MGGPSLLGRGWLSVLPLLTRLDVKSLAPELQHARLQLDLQLLRTAAAASLLINVLTGSIVVVLLWGAVVAGRIPPTAFQVQIVNYGGAIGLGGYFVWHQRPTTALVAGMVVQTAATFGYLWITHESEAFFTIILYLMLPAIVFPLQRMLLLLASLLVVFLALVWLDPSLQRIDSTIPAVVVIVAVVVATFASIGFGLQRALDSLAITLAVREAEVAQRIRVEERTRLLNEQYHRFMAAQHDLRAPCNTALRMVQLLQDPALDPSANQFFSQRLEPLLLRLRTRIDALLDDAKAPILLERRDLPVLDLADLVHNHLPELRQWATIKSVETGLPAPPTISINQCEAATVYAREGELQRILENLVLNSAAAHATTIGIRIARVANAQVEVVVQDDGHGFPDMLLKRSLRATYSQQKGAGLGLVGIAANVAAFGGTLQLENWSDGARVRIRFPLAR